MSKSGGRAGRKRILVVDDAAISLRRIKDTLEKYYDVVPINSGTRALKYLELDKPDLILLDIRMVPKDGFETLHDIRAMEDRADIPVIMLTGVEDKKTVMESIKLGICDYILKPFLPQDLLERIQRALMPEEHRPEEQKTAEQASDKQKAREDTAEQESDKRKPDEWAFDAPEFDEWLSDEG